MTKDLKFSEASLVQVFPLKVKIQPYYVRLVK